MWHSDVWWELIWRKNNLMLELKTTDLTLLTISPLKIQWLLFLYNFLSLSYIKVLYQDISMLLLSRFSHVQLCVTPQTAAHQVPPSLGFSRQEQWSGLPCPSPMQESEKWKWSHSVVSDCLWPHGLQPTRLFRPWDFPGKRYIHIQMHMCWMWPFSSSQFTQALLWDEESDQAKGFLRCVSMGNFKQVKDHYQMIYVGKLFRGPSFKNIFSPLSRPTCKLFGILTSVACAPA